MVVSRLKLDEISSIVDHQQEHLGTQTLLFLSYVLQTHQKVVDLQDDTISLDASLDSQKLSQIVENLIFRSELDYVLQSWVAFAIYYVGCDLILCALNFA